MLVVALVAGCGGQESPKPSTSTTPAPAPVKEYKAEFKLGTPTAVDHVYTMGAQKFADLISAGTNGRIKITVFPNGQLGKGERETLEGLQQGTVDMYAGSTGAMGNFVPAFNMLDVPFLFRDYAHVDKVLDGAIGQSLLDEMPKAQLHGLAFWENGFRNLTNSKRAIKTPDDVKGLKVRTMENQVHIEAWKALGATPTPMTWGEVYGALQQKVIDGQENPVAVIYTAKLNEVQKYLSMTRHVYSPALLAISEQRWKEMPKADQDLFVKTAKEVTAYQRSLGRDNEAKQLAELKSKGMEVIETVDTAPWQAALKPVFDKYAAQYGDRFSQILNTK
jgi:tripartite ATP-independent transporter DctP family solute receptor